MKFFLIYVVFTAAKDGDWKATWNPILDCKSWKLFFKITFMSAMYLNFIDDKVVHPCFVFFQVMGVDPSLKMYPLVDFLVFMSPL